MQLPLLPFTEFPTLVGRLVIDVVLLAPWIAHFAAARSNGLRDREAPAGRQRQRDNNPPPESPADLPTPPSHSGRARPHDDPFRFTPGMIAPRAD